MSASAAPAKISNTKTCSLFNAGHLDIHSKWSSERMVIVMLWQNGFAVRPFPMPAQQGKRWGSREKFLADTPGYEPPCSCGGCKSAQEESSSGEV